VNQAGLIVLPLTTLAAMKNQESSFPSPLSGALRPERIEQSEPPPMNPATTVCLRGPCQHLWRFTCALEANVDDKLHPQRVRTCLRGIEEFDLSDQAVFDCECWWPATLGFVPKSARPTLRQYLRTAWEWVLKRKGSNFDFRWWDESAWEARKK
jgi:hypothetical protein